MGICFEQVHDETHSKAPGIVEPVPGTLLAQRNICGLYREHDFFGLIFLVVTAVTVAVRKKEKVYGRCPNSPILSF